MTVSNRPRPRKAEAGFTTASTFMKTGITPWPDISVKMMIENGLTSPGLKEG
jgi:hypothetical protein